VVAHPAQQRKTKMRTEMNFVCKTPLWIVSIVTFMLMGCSSINAHKTAGGPKTVGPNAGKLGTMGGFWEGHSTLVPSIYYGFTFVESRGHLLGTCFEGGKDGVRLYYLEDCTIHGNQFEGWKTYPPFKLRDPIEGTFQADTCHFIVYYTEGHSDVFLHRVRKLSKAPEVFLDPATVNR